MNAIRVRRRVDSDMLHLPELKTVLGKMVEIIILEETPQPGQLPPAQGCFGPKEAFEPKALEAMRPKLTKEQFEALGAIAAQDLLDVNAIAELRAASVI